MGAHDLADREEEAATGGFREGHGGSHGRRGRRPPPPEATGAEASYLQKNKEAKTRMVVQLLDGESVRGWIEYYDRDMIKINRTDGPNLFVRKGRIRYMYKDPAAFSPEKP